MADNTTTYKAVIETEVKGQKSVLSNYKNWQIKVKKVLKNLKNYQIN